jgi:uncharacterized membrane protein YkvA (DUF1232 family)
MEKDKALESYDGYKKYYSNDGLWDKIAKVAKTAGVKVVYAALLLYYASMSPNISMADKAKIFGALGYFILPIDLIPDAIPVAGYTDDLAALVWALKTIWNNITPDIEEQAYERLTSWFGYVDKSELKLF